MSFPLICALCAFTVTLYAAFELILGLKKMAVLADTGPCPGGGNPRVSVIVPACNEEDNIEQGLLSLLSQQYENLEVIVVNDRSTDSTADILLRLQKSYPQLVVYTVTDLPDGWMGKSHALTLGASYATGEYLLFTDADCMLEKTTISRAIHFLKNRHADHLTLIFQNCSHNWLLDCLISDTGAGLLLMFKPWKVREKGNRFFIGVGAFNLLKNSVYKAVGGHEKIKMHPIDDMMLARTIKKHGFHQECLLAGDYVKVPWYDSVTAMVSGLMKNMFAVVHYRLSAIPFLLAGVTIVSVFPLWGIFFAAGYVRFFCLAAFLIKTLLVWGGMRYQGLPSWYVVGSLFTPYITLYIIVRAAVTTLVRGGIEWRGTVYSLEEMKKSEPFLF
ncbi:MAG: glycosyltransferase [Deltaproteobacteria bacterium]|nr:glycosyltransferase [Deltaproteobacteria bacterium]